MLPGNFSRQTCDHGRFYRVSAEMYQGPGPDWEITVWASTFLEMYSISILNTSLVKRKGPLYILYIVLHVKVIHVFITWMSLSPPVISGVHLVFKYKLPWVLTPFLVENLAKLPDILHGWQSIIISLSNSFFHWILNFILFWFYFLLSTFISLSTKYFPFPLDLRVID